VRQLVLLKKVVVDDAAAAADDDDAMLICQLYTVDSACTTTLGELRYDPD